MVKFQSRKAVAHATFQACRLGVASNTVCRTGRQVPWKDFGAYGWTITGHLRKRHVCCCCEGRRTEMAVRLHELGHPSADRRVGMHGWEVIHPHSHETVGYSFSGSAEALYQVQ